MNEAVGAPPFSSLAGLLEWAASRAPNRPYLYAGDETVTLGEFERRASRTARALEGLGVSRGDIVATVAANSAEELAVFFGAHKLGAAVVPLNPEWGADELAYPLGHAAAKLVLADAEAADVARKAAPPGAKVLALAGDGASCALPKLGDLVAAQPDAQRAGTARAHDLAFIYYTSGTTGRPKGVPLEHANVLSYYQSGAPGSDADALDSDERPRVVLMVILPLFHVNAMITCVSSIRRGITVALERRFSLRRFWPTVERRGVNIVSAVPTIFSLLLSEAQLADGVDRGSLMLFVTGAAHMPPELLRRFEERFGVMVLEGYGLTEGTVVSTVNPIGERKIGSVGKALAGQEIAILADDGKALATGEVGEVCIRGGNVMKGYYRDEEGSQEVLRDGWLHTGDVGHLDAEGYLFLCGRKKDLIIRGGENIAPGEVENAILSHPDVVEAAVVGAADPIWGETVVAFVVPASGKAIDPAALRSHVAGRLAAFKVPERILVRSDLPRNAMGKVLKRELRQQVRTGPDAAASPAAAVQT